MALPYKNKTTAAKRLNLKKRIDWSLRYKLQTIESSVVIREIVNGDREEFVVGMSKIATWSEIRC